MKKIDMSLIIPAFNEGASFEKSVGDIVKQLKRTHKKWELIFVEDKSNDSTKKSVERLIKTIDNSKAIYHSKNQGRGKSVTDGLKLAKGHVCGYLDVDLEVSATYIPLFISEIEQGSDLVVGQRFYEGGLNTLGRYLLSKIYALAVKSILDLNIDDTEAGYKFFNRKKILPLLSKVKSKHWFWDTEICAWAHKAGLEVTQIPVLFNRREDKESTVKIIPDTVDYIRNLIRLRREIA